VRWGNVGRVIGLVALVAAVVAWPPLGGGAIVAPGGEAVPLVAETPVPRRDAPGGQGGAAAADGAVERKPDTGRRGGERPDGAGRRGTAQGQPPRSRLPRGRSERRRSGPSAPDMPAADPPTVAPSPAPSPPTRVREAPPAPVVPGPPPVDAAEREFGFER
jgi:hypothetical protein